MPVNSPTMLKAMMALVPTGARLREAITEVHWPARYQPFSTNSKMSMMIPATTPPMTTRPRSILPMPCPSQEDRRFWHGNARRARREHHLLRSRDIQQHSSRKRMIRGRTRKERNSRMYHLTKFALGAAAIGAIAASAPAQAGVHVSVGVGIPLPGVWYGPPGPCAGYNYTYGAPWDNCGYDYYADPVYIGGVWYHGPFYSRYWHGRQWFWWHGGWRANEWRGDPFAWRAGVRWGDGAYWRNGHWADHRWEGRERWRDRH